MADRRVSEELRVALFGRKGCGKSSLGNTLLGSTTFRTATTCESGTRECQEGKGTLPSGQNIRVVDTPGIFDTKKQSVHKEITRCLECLSPGPHAFIIVLEPSRATSEEKRHVTELIKIFEDEMLFKHSLIVMVRGNEIIDGELNIHEFIQTRTSEEVRLLYKKCGKRIVAVENFGSQHEKRKYAEEIAHQIQAMDGYFSYEYFCLRQKRKLQEDKITELENELREKTKTSCSIQ